MKIGFIFPGQGSQHIGMGKDLYEKHPEVKKVYQMANQVLDISLEDITFYGTEEELAKTKNTQIAIFVMCMGILKVLEKYGIEAKIATGLSLGEYTALQYAGAFSFLDGILLVWQRGKFMQEFVPQGEWAMAAIIGLFDDQVEACCKQVKEGFVEAVNYNCLGQVAISGEKEAVQKAGEIAKEKGAKKVVTLKTSGPFHTKLLGNAAELLKIELEKYAFHPMKCQVIRNLDGELYKKGDDLVSILYQHMISPVKFHQGIEKMLAEGVDTFIEIGPGKVLSSFVKKTAKEVDRQVQIFQIEDEKTLQEVVGKIKELEEKGEKNE